MPLACIVCGGIFEVVRSAAWRRKTCGRRCSNEIRRVLMTGNKWAVGNKPNVTCFKPGHSTWNKGMRGRHFSLATEFKKGATPVNWTAVGTVRIRTFRRHNNQRAFVKVAEPNIWKLRAVVNWEQTHGPIPSGLFLHHLDHDSLNDDVRNLALVDRAAHLRLHRPDFEERRLKALREKTSRHPSQADP